VSILVETEVQKLPQINSVIGIDLGLKDFAILSNGTTCVNPKFSRRKIGISNGLRLSDFMKRL
jgi:putative transposase